MEQQRNKVFIKKNTTKARQHQIDQIESDKNYVAIDMSKECIEIFEKKKVLKRATEEFSIPSCFFEEFLWKDSDLNSIKASLNKTKSQMDSINLKKWHRYTKKMNTSALITPRVQKLFNPSYVTQSWCKFLECLNTYPIIPKWIIEPESGRIPLNSVHLSEAPGGFISATNHFIQTQYPYLEWNWLGTTLNPYYEGNDVISMVEQDKFILSTLKNWTFLQDNSGNIMSEDNVDYLVQHVENKFKSPDGKSQKVSLVTADGSVDCQANPMEQEATVAQLHFAEIVASLLILGDGGTFVLKMFTFLECKAISHLYLLCSLFKEVHLFKPATSTEGNSEVYVVCLGYYGKLCFFKELMELKKRIGAGDGSQRYSLISKKTALVSPFYDRLKDAAKFFTAHQIAVINRNVDVYNNIDSYVHTDILRMEVSKNWMRKFKPAALMPAEQLFRRLNSQKVDHVDKPKEEGRFLDKLKRESAGVFRKLVYIREDLPYFKNYGQLKWIGEEIHGDKNQFSPQKGKPYENILSSRFTFGKLLLTRKELRNVVKQLGPIFKNSSISAHLDCSNHEMLLKKLCQSFYPIEKTSKNGYWTLHKLCFRETAQDLIFTEDINQTHIGLYNLMEKLSKIKKGDSLFLCQFPMLTRLHVGLIYMLSTVFEKTYVYLQASQATRGIVLHNFEEFSFDDSYWTFLFSRILDDLQENCNSVSLQIVPIKVLIDLMDSTKIFEYNLFNASVNMQEIIFETTKTFLEAGDIGMKLLTETDVAGMEEFFGSKHRCTQLADLEGDE